MGLSMSRSRRSRLSKVFDPLCRTAAARWWKETAKVQDFDFDACACWPSRMGLSMSRSRRRRRLATNALWCRRSGWQRLASDKRRGRRLATNTL
jgi:hypothetical protein